MQKYDDTIDYLSKTSDSKFSFEALGIKEVTRGAVQKYFVELTSYICALEKNIQGMSKIDHKEVQENKLQLDSERYLASLKILYEKTDKKYYSDYISGACIII